MTFNLKNIAHVKTTLVGVALVGAAVASVFMKYADWGAATPVIVLGAGFMGIGPSAKKEDEPK